ncbi:hypothetical protein [Bradyrhizobium sp. McL0616]|uniref:hypothetical protein n=1 Tax=Bradyrhizobium sp. McL0616 TaxID=3415674 RepID=UPI003CF10342
MAWRDDKARSTLIRDAAGSVQPGRAPRSFAELLFGYTNVEDLANHDASSLAFLAEQAWGHVRAIEAASGFSSALLSSSPIWSSMSRSFLASGCWR